MQASLFYVRACPAPLDRRISADHELVSLCPPRSCENPVLRPKLVLPSLPHMQKFRYRFYWKMQKLIVPGLQNSQYTYCAQLRRLLRTGTRWLDVGCGRQFFAPWMRVNEAELVRSAALVVGMDYDAPSLIQHRTMPHRLRADIEKAPFRSGSFDLITANMVVEHIEKPEAALKEINRLLAPGGVFLFHTTNYRNYQVAIASMIPQKVKNKIVGFLESREEADIFPAYYRLNTPGAVRAQAVQCGFEVEEMILTNSSAETIRLGPVVVAELLTIRALNSPRLAEFRSNIVVALRKVRN